MFRSLQRSAINVTHKALIPRTCGDYEISWIIKTPITLTIGLRSSFTWMLLQLKGEAKRSSSAVKVPKSRISIPKKCFRGLTLLLDEFFPSNHSLFSPWISLLQLSHVLTDPACRREASPLVLLQLQQPQPGCHSQHSGVWICLKSDCPLCKTIGTHPSGRRNTPWDFPVQLV